MECTIPFADFARHVAPLRGQLDAATARVLDKGWFVLGGEGEAFERELAETLGAPHAAGVGSGTDAIEVALRVLGVGRGDEVVTQANTCVPTVAGIMRAGATPVLCDVEPDSAVIAPASLAEAITPRTRAIVPVHLFGQCADMDAVLDVAGDVPVVEDCAQAAGATFRGRAAGTMGALGAFSFYPTKNLGAVGDGGAVLTADAQLDERVRLVRQYGQAARYDHVAEGVNSRLDELQAAYLRVKLPHLTTWNERRAAIAAHYAQELEDSPVQPLVQLADRGHVFHLFVVRVPTRDAFQDHLASRGVRTLVHYPRPVHAHAPYRHLTRPASGLGVSERLAEEIVSLPLYPELTDAEVEYVARAAREAALAVYSPRLGPAGG